jgi:4a-hydroxytetrahydrobiopterin dehydratase
MDFTTKKCVPCEGGVPSKTAAEVDEALASLAGWDAREGKTQLHKHYRFKDFVEAMAFVNALAALAEAEGHHPDFSVHWNAVDVTLWTHAIGGLSENDFIVAAKLDQLPQARAARR